ncbi:putative dirigent protein [Helianthus annuus]|nr:putative dirigent protein [Helianthus annuus]
MASLLKNTLTITFYFILSSSLLHPSNGAYSEDVSKASSMIRVEKTTHLHFFFHDLHSGKSPTAIKIIGIPNSGGFGDVYVMDNALTERQEATSDVVGRAQGMYTFAAQNQPVFLMVLTFEFTQGEFSGSSLSVLGRNPIMDDVREMPIIGGSGQFRYANGYALAHTVWADPTTSDAIVEYNVYVKHYNNGEVAASSTPSPAARSRFLSLLSLFLFSSLFLMY